MAHTCTVDKNELGISRKEEGREYSRELREQKEERIRYVLYSSVRGKRRNGREDGKLKDKKEIKR